MEQMLLNVVANGKYKPEHFKHHHVEYFLKYAKEFLQLLDSLFSKDWDPTLNEEPFRRIFVHGWPFALKALASAYHRSRIDELGPLSLAMGHTDAGKTLEEAYASKVNELTKGWTKKPEVTFDRTKEPVRANRLDKVQASLDRFDGLQDEEGEES